jgi:hypothetical protein
MQPERVRLTIDIELDSEPIAGSMQRSDGDRTPFDGWIELVSLLQEAATREQPKPDTSGDGDSRLRRVR